MAWPVVFAALPGPVALANLDANFNAAVELTVFNTLNATVAGLPSSAIPLIPVAGGAAGASAALSRDDHQHPPQSATVNLQTATTYTVLASDNGKIVELSNAGAITVTIPNSLPVGFNCGFCQVSAGQVTFVAASGGTQRQASGHTKTRAQWSEVSMRVRANSGGSAAEYVLSGDMAA